MAFQSHPLLIALLAGGMLYYASFGVASLGPGESVAGWLVDVISILTGFSLLVHSLEGASR